MQRSEKWLIAAGQTYQRQAHCADSVGRRMRRPPAIVAGAQDCEGARAVVAVSRRYQVARAQQRVHRRPIAAERLGGFRDADARLVILACNAVPGRYLPAPLAPVTSSVRYDETPTITVSGGTAWMVPCSGPP